MGILVSSGDDRVIPILSILKDGYVSHLITGTVTAEKVLHKMGSSAKAEG